MARVKTTKVETPKDKKVEFNEIRGLIREELTKRYGGVSKFLHSEKGKEFGGIKSKIYLYDSGPVSFDVIKGLCKFLGIGELKRKIVVSRSFSYSLNESTTTD